MYFLSLKVYVHGSELKPLGREKLVKTLDGIYPYITAIRKSNGDFELFAQFKVSRRPIFSLGEERMNNIIG